MKTPKDRAKLGKHEIPFFLFLTEAVKNAYGIYSLFYQKSIYLKFGYFKIKNMIFTTSQAFSNFDFLISKYGRFFSKSIFSYMLTNKRYVLSRERY